MTYFSVAHDETVTTPLGQDAERHSRVLALGNQSITGFPPSAVISEDDDDEGEVRNQRDNGATQADIEIDRRTGKPGQYTVSEVTPIKGLNYT